MNLYFVYLIAIYGLRALVQPTDNCKELNSCLYNCGWFLYIWGRLCASFSQLWSIPFVYLSVPCLYKFCQFLYICGILYICGTCACLNFRRQTPIHPGLKCQSLKWVLYFYLSVAAIVFYLIKLMCRSCSSFGQV